MSWTPVVDSSVSTEYYRLGGRDIVRVPIPNAPDGDLFTLDASVKIKVNNASGADADAIAGQWQIKIVQNIVAFGGRPVDYVFSHFLTTSDRIPWLDIIDPASKE